MLRRIFSDRGWIVLVAIAVVIKIFAFFPAAVEKYYSSGLYQLVARLLRILFGWIPFSVGDIFYIVVFVWLIFKLVSFFKKLITRQVHKEYVFNAVGKTVKYLLVVYILFNILWGLNYDRKGIASQLQLEVRTYSTRDLQDILQVIVHRLNQFDSSGRLNRTQFNRKSFLFEESEQSYKNLSSKNTIFKYTSPSVKPSLFSYLGNYLGFTGYYNPFSGEAQVNTTVPVYIQPFTTCHEIGHQLGYAKENEANFAGYLSARSSDDPAFRYSVYFDIYIYAATELYVRDSTLMVPLREQLNPGVRKDFRNLREFFRKYNNPFEPYIRRLYGRYLKANNQPQGIMTYDEVIAWLIAYYKKYGESSF
jgi:hypothetical protein